ncbi:hypothetical protein FGE12_10915 [Aggregicoccus sp. 17bor-14]|uniref:hypothetical protein n=1 Tax=Myxococcaceae TaxID=31 RepID=UPI00129C2273|nr:MULTISPECIES: hypothetical protein [Myxococcaceae]MBF5042899.1 hypothetical protein [Simulacricoccus sp. 17bor-14]MRI88666.1 hypothetical protein [Aggregicoccus sp. 17bor-14]
MPHCPRRPAHLPLLLCLAPLLLPACSHAPAQAAPAPAASTVRPFTFAVSFWPNVHEALLFDAQSPTESPAVHAPEWGAAVAYYRSHLRPGPLAALADPRWAEVRRRLASLADAAPLEGAGVDPELAPLLARAAEAYRAQRWPTVRQEGQAWVSRMRPQVEAQAAALVPELERVLGVPWPTTPIGVQVCERAGRFGAYTTVRESLVTLSYETRGDAQALETVFHEGAHVRVFPLRHALEAELQRQGKEAPPMLWHALLFFTTDELTRRHLPQGHVPHAEAQGLYAQNPAWTAFHGAMRQEWRPYLEGRVDRATAMQRLVAAYTPPPGTEASAPRPSAAIPGP